MHIPIMNKGALRTVVAAALIAALGTISAVAQTTGTIAGKVKDIRTGQYLENARVTVKDTGKQALTDSFGQFRITGVPTGTADVTVFFTGYYSATQTIEVNESIVSNVEIDLRSRSAFDSEEDIYELDAFVVKSQYDAQAAAIHEQRFAESNKAVIDAEALGNINEGNIGEFVKFLPGISINYVAADVRSIEVRGMGDTFTNVTIDGNMMASASSSNMNRTFELEQVSLNNVERVEVVKVPTPDMPANSLGGSVNLVSKSAFERDGREIRYNAYLSMNNEAIEFKTPGPGNTEKHKILPGVRLTYADVYNDGKLGIIVNYLNSNQFNPQHRSRFRWSFEDYSRGLSNPTPVFRRYQMQDGPKLNYRQSLNLKLDYKLSDDTILLTSLQWNDYESRFRNTNVQWDTDVRKTPDNQTTQSGVILGAANDSRIDFGASWRDKYGTTWHGDAKIQHNMGDLKLEGGAFWSKGTNRYRSGERGFAENGAFTYRPVDGTLQFSNFGGDGDIDKDVTITHIDSSGTNNPGIGVSDLSVYSLSEVTPYRPKNGEDKIVGMNFDATWNFDTDSGLSGYWKSGLKYTSQKRHTEDVRTRYYHVGPDGKRDSGDEVSGTQFINDNYAFNDPHYGLPSVIAWTDMGKVLDYFLANPNYFTVRGTDGAGINDIQEDILAAYAMGSINLMNNKVQVTGGVRWEKTDVTARGDQDVRDIESDYTTLHPSINVRWDITDKLVGRVAFAQTIGRQNFSQLLPNIQVSYPDADDEDGEGSVTANNPGLKPQHADNLDFTLEYYTDNAGVISVGYFYKKITDYIRDTVSNVTQAEINQYGLSSDTMGFLFNSNENAGEGKVKGWEFNLQQELTFLPEALKGFAVFANGTFLDIEGDFGTDEVVTDLKGFVSETYNFGLSWQRWGWTTNLKFTHKGRELIDPYGSDGASSIGDAYLYNDTLEMVDFDLEYMINPNYTVYFSARNLGNEPQNRVIRANSIDLYVLERSEEYGVQFSIGVKGKF